MTVPYPDAFSCSNQIYEREHLGMHMVCKRSFVSVNYSKLEEPWNWEENPYFKDAKYMIMDFTSSQVRTTLILLYHKLLKKYNTFNPIICKSKKKTNLFCFLTTFQNSTIRKRNAKKSIKTHKKIWNPALLGIRNPLSWNPESSTRNPESTVWNPESKTLLDSLTWGEK